MTSKEDNRPAIERLLRPRSVVIVGASTRAGSAGQTILDNLTLNEFAGPIHLLGRTGGMIGERAIVTEFDALPEGIDLAVLCVPANGAVAAIEGCARRGVAAAVVFAAGFAEMGEHGLQAELAAAARAGGVAMLGPNCLGYINALDGIRINFAGAARVARVAASGADPMVAVISHSGGLVSHIRSALEARDVAVNHSVSTGNEADLGLADFIEYFTDDADTGAIVLYVEQVRDPARFLVAARRAAAAGKPVLMMHPGRGERARSAVQSHTGALAGDYAVMAAQVAAAGIALVETMDELVDAAELLARYPVVPVQGPGVLTFSGAFCAIANDFCESIGLDLPPLSAATAEALAARLPPFAPPRNPLDLTTQPVFEPELVEVGARALLGDAGLGGLVLSIASSTPRLAMVYLRGVIAARDDSARPVIFSLLGDRAPLADEFMALAREQRVILSRSVDRSLRAMAVATRRARALARAERAERTRAGVAPLAGIELAEASALVEWRGKELLARLGIASPAHALVGDVEEAVAAAARIGGPVALKAQSAALTHKTEVGGVVLGLADAAAVRAGWARLMGNIAAHRPGLELDGVLVEAMAPRGVELVLGARRDPGWGPVLLVGIGGVAIEALGDVRLLPCDLAEADIIAELRRLRAARLLEGFRGLPAVDLAAVAAAVAAVGRLMLSVPSISEIDINPLLATAQGVLALDALIVSG